MELRVAIGYSSTCPCSAALARQLIRQRFAKDFAEHPLTHDEVLAWLGSPQGILATPHSQRSSATLQVRLSPHGGADRSQWRRQEPPVERHRRLQAAAFFKVVVCP